MRWSNWLLSLAAVTLLVVVGAMVSRQSNVTPEDFFAAVEKRIQDGRYDREQTLQNLDQVLERAREAGDVDLETRVLLRRGRILMEMASWDRARTDLLAVAERRPDITGVEDDLAELETRAGDFAAAEARVRRRLDREPDSAEAWVRLGRLHRAAAAEQTEVAAKLMAKLLGPDELAEARAVFQRAAALDPEDLARPAAFESLRQRLRDEDEETLQSVLRAADRGAEECAKARAAYTRALDAGVIAEPIAGLLELFATAGRDGLAADLASAGLRLDVLRADAAVARTLLASLERLGRTRFAGELARGWIGRTGPNDGEFLQLLARLGLATERWAIAIDAGQTLRGSASSDDAYVADYYQGLALVATNQDAIGRTFLRRFVASTAPDPVPGARATAWRAIAQASRVLGEPGVEREAIQGAIEVDLRSDGELHLHLAELLMAAPHGGFRKPERRYAIGMSLLPERTAELLPRWHEIGAKELASIGFDPEAVRAVLVRNNVWKPSLDAGPYELYRLAEIHLAAGDSGRALNHLQRLLEIVPDFLPALDLVVEVARLQDDRARLLSAVATRVAVGGRTPETSAVLREISFDELQPRDVRRLMRLDPDYFGRVAAARALADDGRGRSALQLLRTINHEAFGHEARLLGARLHLEAGEPKAAWALLSPLGESLTASPEAAALAMRAALWSDVPEQAHVLAQVLAASARLPRATRLALAETALATGEMECARPLLRALDAEPAWRGGDLCLQLALAAALGDEIEQARHALRRAEAFDTRGGLERASFAIDLHVGGASSAEASGLKVLQRGGSADPLMNAALLVVLERDDDARALVDAAFATDGLVDPRWSILARVLPSETLPDDPRLLGAVMARAAGPFVDAFAARGNARDAAGLVAQSLVAEGRALAVHRLRSVLDEGGAGSPWAAWLLAGLERAQGNLEAAQRLAQAVREAAPDFAPAWEFCEAVDPELQFDFERFAAFRGARLLALGSSSAISTSVGREDRARALTARGEYAQALVVAEALGEDPASADLLTITGRSLLASGRPREAVERLARALSSTPPPLDARGAVGIFLEAIDAASDSGDPLPRAEAQALFRELALAHPDDPRLVLAVARVDLELDPRNPVLGVRKALARLDEYRVRHKGRPLDREVPGAAAAWIDFLALLDPDRALHVADEELDLLPGSISTWIARARALEAAGDRRRALAELAIAGRIADPGGVSREILRIRSWSDMDPADVERAIADIVRLEGKSEPDVSLHLLAARSYQNLGPRHARESLAAARRALADARIRPGERRMASTIGALALLALGTEAGLSEAQALVDEALRHATSPSERDFLRALHGLARPAPAAPKQ